MVAMRWLLLPSLLTAFAGCGGVAGEGECDDTGACAAPRESVAICEGPGSNPAAPAGRSRGEWCIELRPDGSCTASVAGKSVSGARAAEICRALRP